MTTEQLEALSLDWEERTGYDSIPTIVRIYDRTPSGAFMCPWPKCRFSRRGAEKMWRHVHTAHGKNGLPPEAKRV